MPKYTDEQIKKALMQCKAEYSCEGCPYQMIEDCFIQRNADTLDFINRQEAEIERLKKEVSAQFEKALCAISNPQCDGCAELTKSEAIKEFAERLVFEIVNKPSEFKAVQATADFLTGMSHRQHEILDIVKEMVGESK